MAFRPNAKDHVICLVAVIGVGNGHGDNAVVGMPVEVAMPVVAALGVSMVVVVVEMVVAMRHCRSISGGHGVVMVIGSSGDGICRTTPVIMKSGFLELVSR